MTDKLAKDEALLGLGGNIGDVIANLKAAIGLLDADPSVDVKDCSPVYKTPPWGVEDQPWFHNCGVRLTTRLEPQQLLVLCLETEKQLKRVRNQRWGPRTIDIDVLAFGDQTMESETLTLPHPRMFDRAFVLTPLADIAGSVALGGKTIADWAKEMDDPSMEKQGLPADWWRVG